jgi:hypothetical protein
MSSVLIQFYLQIQTKFLEMKLIYKSTGQGGKHELILLCFVDKSGLNLN